MPLSEYLKDTDWHQIWQAVRELRREHPRVFSRYQESVVASLVMDILASADDVPTLEELAQELAARADDEGPWLITTPIANIVTPEPAVQLADDAVLWRAELGTDWMDQRFGGGDGDNSEFDVHRLLGDRLPRTTRWLRAPEERRIDTRRGATILSVEEGSIALAVAHARAKAHYALAVWAVLSPPGEWQLLPDLGLWGPSALFCCRQAARLVSS